MASRDSFRLMGALACLGAFLIAGGQPSRGANYDPGTPPSMTAPGEVLPGQGWGLGDLEDIDHYGDGDPTPLYDEVQIVEVTVIDECGNSQPLSGDSAARGDDPPFWGRNIPQRPGTYYVWVKIDDLPKYYDDPPREFFWTIVVRDFHDGPWDCKSCPDRRKPSRPFKGIELVFPLGTTTDGESAGALWLVEYEPRAQLVSPNSVHYDHPSGADGITVSQRDSNGAFYVETPAFRADVVYVNNHKFEVRLADVGTQTVFRKWVVEEIDGSTIHDDVRVTEYVDDDGTLIVWSKADYDWSENPDPKWTLTTREGADQVLQIEEVTWVDIQSGPPAIKEQRYVRKAPAGTAVYREYIQHTEFAPGWRQTQRVVDPGGADLTTTWSYVLSNGLRLRSEQRPDGSWTYFNQSVGTSLVVENISGWKDQAYISSPSLTHSGVQGVQLTYPAAQKYRLSQVREYLGGALVRAADYSHTLFSGGRTESTTIQNWLDTSGSAKLTSVTFFENHDLTRVNYADFPDGRRDDYTYHDEIQFTSGSSPSYDLNQAGDYNYREVVHGYVNNGALAVVSGKSTKETTILDLVGHPVFEETFVANSGSWVRLDWVYREYDVQGRLTATHRANGTSETTEYSACCGRTVTDAVGVVTTYTDDPLGRPSSFTRAAVSGTGYQTQPAITTEYDYSVPSAVTVAVSAGGLSQTTIREYDLAGRVNSERTANGGGHDLKTLYDYQTTSEGGREVIVYRDYPTDAVSGTEGVRDEITSYFCDGQFKSRTGATVVARYQNYGSAAGERWMITSEGAPAADPPDADDRYEKTTYDMLGRVKAEARPGWAASGTATLTSTYYYDASGADAGLLKRILRSHAAGTLHQYDELAGITYSAVDADNDGTLDLTGPDRVTRAASAYEYDGTLGAWAWVNRSWVLPSSGASTEVLTDVRKQVVPAFLDGVIAESHSFDVAGRETITTTELDSGDHVVTATTNVPGSTTAELRITHGGRLVRTVSATGVESLFGYDALGRRTRTRDGRGNWSVTVLDAQGRPTDEYNGVEDPEQPGTGARTQYGYYAPGSDHPGRLYWVQVPDVTGSTSKKSYYAYNARGQTTQVWGNVPYPTLTAYNAFGEREELTTFRDTTIDFTGATWPGVGENDGDTTTWTIDAATGLVERKTYADGEYVDDTYTAAGQLCTHTWARAGGGLTTTYNYNDGESGETWTGERIGINYSDANTPDVTTGYDRLGRTAWVKDGAGKRQCAYDPNTLALNTETFVDDQDPNIDLAGQRDGESREAAGGIGGLLAVHDSTISAGVDYLYAYDAGGNVGQAVSVSPATWDASSVLVARYEYDPYGAVTAQAGTYAATNPIRWSTKYWDAETALGYWGERWYDAGMGRWTSGDPIGESGGHNLFAYAMNQPVGHVDPDGRFLWGCNAKPQPPPRNPCDDCWQTCKDNQGLLAGDGGGWICRDDGCRCACVNDTAFPPTGQPDDEALRKSALAHEEDHVSRDGTDCSCSPKPCRGGSKPGTRKDRECYASAAEINCLCGERQSCGTDTNCTKRINDRIKQMEDYCKGFGGDVYKHGAKSCP